MGSGFESGSGSDFYPQSLRDQLAGITRSKSSQRRYRLTRTLTDYCGIVVEKTGRITRNVGNFIQTHRLIPNRNYFKRTNKNINHDIKLHNFTNYADYDRHIEESNTRLFNSTHDQWSQMNFVVNSNIESEYRQEQNQTVFIDEIESNNRWPPESQRQRQQITRFKQNDVEFFRHGNLNSRMLYSNLPRSSRLRNNYFDGHFNNFNRSLTNAKSLHDLTDADIDRVLERDTTFHLPTSIMRTRSEYGSTGSMSLLERYRQFYEETEDDRDDNYLKLYQSLSKLDRFMPKEKYVPGKVHYEREYRIYGRDTVALIYYKTCYL